MRKNPVVLILKHGWVAGWILLAGWMMALLFKYGDEVLKFGSLRG